MEQSRVLNVTFVVDFENKHVHWCTALWKSPADTTTVASWGSQAFVQRRKWQRGGNAEWEPHSYASWKWLSPSLENQRTQKQEVGASIMRRWCLRSRGFKQRVWTWALQEGHHSSPCRLESSEEETSWHWVSHSTEFWLTLPSNNTCLDLKSAICVREVLSTFPHHFSLITLTPHFSTYLQVVGWETRTKHHLTMAECQPPATAQCTYCLRISPVFTLETSSQYFQT